jgi:hypothetical protein
MLPARVRDKEAEREALKTPNRTKRFTSQKHRDYVRTFACSKCGETAGIEVAHVRLGTDGGMGRKPSDYFTVSLCKPCHARQHSIGEATFWHGQNINAIMQAFCETSPAKFEIAKAIQERS